MSVVGSVSRSVGNIANGVANLVDGPNTASSTTASGGNPASAGEGVEAQRAAFEAMYQKQTAMSILMQEQNMRTQEEKNKHDTILAVIRNIKVA
jgi:hypothetical protein